MRIDCSKPEGNAFAIVDAVFREIRKTRSYEEAMRYRSEAFEGDYKNLLAVSKKWVKDLEFDNEP